METSELKSTIDSDLKKREKYRLIVLVVVAIASLVSFVILFMHFPITPVAEKEVEAPVVVRNVYEGIDLTAQAAIVYDLAKGETLYSENAEAQLPLASLTKLLTVYAALDAIPNSAAVAISPSALAEEGESGFILGDSFAFEDLARLALVGSSNDAASAIAEEAGKRRSFTGAALLASAAQSAGLTQTYATNGTGLDESLSVSGGYGSARDVAILAGALLAKAPDIAAATTKPTLSVMSVEGKSFEQKNTNQEAVRVPGMLLSKTGFTDLAGGNLAVVFDAGIDHPIAIVVLGSTREGRFDDVDRLLERTLEKFAEGL